MCNRFAAWMAYETAIRMQAFGSYFICHPLFELPIKANIKNIRSQNHFFIKNRLTSNPLDMNLQAEKQSQLKALVYRLIACLIEVKNQLGPFLNEYMYQDALEIEFRSREITFEREHYFSVEYKGARIQHKHFVDFLCVENGQQIIVECKAVEHLTPDHRQQLWNYMRLTGVRVGILYNFAPVKAQIERYYLPEEGNNIVAF